MDSSLIKRTFIFLRHGESEGNVRSLCQGKQDFPLTELGRSQARAAAITLKQYQPVSKIYSSDLKRAYETARIVALGLECQTIVPLEGLRERGWGELERCSNRLMFEQEELESDPCYMEPSSIQGLEELSIFKKRIFDVMSEILEDSEVATPMVVGHGRFFRSLCSILGVEPESQIPNATPLWCGIENDRWIVRELKKIVEEGQLR